MAKIKLNSSIDSFYLDIFSLLNDTFLELRPKEVEVLAALYTKNYNLIPKIKDEKSRMTILFSSDSKKELAESLNLGYNSFMNNITALRKKQFIVNNMLNKKFYFNPKSTKIEIEICII